MRSFEYEWIHLVRIIVAVVVVVVGGGGELMMDLYGWVRYWMEIVFGDVRLSRSMYFDKSDGRRSECIYTDEIDAGTYCKCYNECR